MRDLRPSGERVANAIRRERAPRRSSLATKPWVAATLLG